MLILLPFTCYNGAMIIGVDIGGTKTELAIFAQNGKLLEEVRFPTPKNYGEFLDELTKTASKHNTQKAKIGYVAVPGLLNRQAGIVYSLGNLNWHDKPIRKDVASAIGVDRVYIENDSKLAGLAEARYIRDKYSRVFYLTISTGIGGALMINGKLSQDMIDMEIGKMPLKIGGKIKEWEDWASGRAFFETYGKKAVDVEDDQIWQEYCQKLNPGITAVCSIFQPEAIIFGGGMGQRLSRFEKFITPYLNENLHPIVRRPEALLSTHYRGQSVIYGCYEYAADRLR